MNILDIQDKLKGLSQDQLSQEMQSPSGAVPQFLVLGELNRRQSMRQSMQQQNAGSKTVAQELLNSAGIPEEGASDMAQAMAPKSSIAQNTGIASLPQEAPPPEQGGIAALAPQDQQPTGMYAGGPVRKMADGSNGTVSSLPWWLSGDLFGRNVTPYSEARKAPDGPDSHRVVDGYQLQMMQDQQARQDAQNILAANSPPSPVDPREQNAIEAGPQKVVAPKTDPFASTVGTKSNSAPAAPKMSTYEQMLADAMGNADKKAKQDKWLALAQAGMALMSSNQSTLGGALGEAGTAGIAGLQSARDTAEKTKLALAQEQYGIEEKKAALARSLAAAGASAASKGTPSSAKVVSEVSDLQKMIDSMTKPDPNNPMGEVTLSEPDKVTVANMMHRRDMLLQWLNQNGFGSADLADQPQGDGSQ